MNRLFGLVQFSLGSLRMNNVPILNSVRTKYKLKTRKSCAKRFHLLKKQGTKTKLTFRPKQRPGSVVSILSTRKRWHFKKMLPYYANKK